MTQAHSETMIYLEGNDQPINYIDFEYRITYNPVWSNGVFDGSFIPKQIGTIRNPPEGKIVLLDGRVILFSAVEEREDKSLTIKQPYYVTEWTRRIEP